MAAPNRLHVPGLLRRFRGMAGRVLAGACALALTGCRGGQSALEPAGQGAERIADLFWAMSLAGAIIWLAVVWLTLSAIRGRLSTSTERQARLFIIGGGALFPTLLLGALLVYGLALLPQLMRAPESALRVAVTGEQWWWRIRYRLPGGAEVELANEIRLPVGEPVEFELDSADVIHSFWIPPLGGKMDMIPGRRTRLVLTPTRTGVFRGVCAEYCGTAHALMAFYVVVLDKQDFNRWLERQQRPAGEPPAPLAAQGRREFLANGCSACHTIGGTEARGVIGPNLTHVGGRLSLGAGIVKNDSDGFLRWIERTAEVKPGVHMPHFGMLPPEELRAIAAYLQSLK